MSLPDRQAELVATHRAIQAADLPYVLVGGWAVSTFQTRFTTDVDMVIPGTDLDAYDTLLTDRGYELDLDAEVAGIYEGRIVSYTKPVGEYHVEFDALVDAIRCRQTDAEWSYRYLHEHSVERPLEVAPELTAQIPEPALLFALKLHSGRLADARDLVLISTEAAFDQIERHLYRGDLETLDSQIQRVDERLASEAFEDSFKGVFQQQTFPADAIEEVRSFLTDLRTQL